MRKNSAKYRNRWIALCNSQLAADTASLDELIEQVGEENMKGIFFTVIY